MQVHASAWNLIISSSNRFSEKKRTSPQSFDKASLCISLFHSTLTLFIKVSFKCKCALALFSVCFNCCRVSKVFYLSQTNFSIHPLTEKPSHHLNTQQDFRTFPKFKCREIEISNIHLPVPSYFRIFWANLIRCQRKSFTRPNVRHVSTAARKCVKESWRWTNKICSWCWNSSWEIISRTRQNRRSHESRRRKSCQSSRWQHRRHESGNKF